MVAVLEAILLVLAAFVPPVAYVVWIRNLERHEREPWKELAKMFVWGAVGGVLLGILFSVVLIELVGPTWDAVIPVLAFASVAAFFVAPLAEEPAKALGLWFVRDPHAEPEDGLVYGAAVGLGFAASENLIYFLVPYLQGDINALVVTAAIRTWASAFLHAAASAVVGYGVLRPIGLVRKLGWIALGVGIHAAYNGLLTLGVVLQLFTDPLVYAVAGFVAALSLAVGVFGRVRHHVRYLDASAKP